MQLWMYEDERRKSAERRQAPGEGQVLKVPWTGIADLAAVAADPPTDIHLEATDAEGETPVWLDDYFWLQLIERWPGRPLTLHLLPTPEALLHPVVLHALHMLRRVVPHWRLVGHCYVSDLASDERVSLAAVSPYHVLRIIDGVRPGATVEHRLTATEAIAALRRVQTSYGRTTPALMRCPAPETSRPAGVPAASGAPESSVLGEAPRTRRLAPKAAKTASPS